MEGLLYSIGTRVVHSKGGMRRYGLVTERLSSAPPGATPAPGGWVRVAFKDGSTEVVNAAHLEPLS